jgi:hypothetical protein
METILDLSDAEIRDIMQTLKGSEFYKANMLDIFEDSFLAVTSTKAKVDNFKLLKAIAPGKLQGTEEEQEMGLVFEKIITLVSSIFRCGVSTEEFGMIAEDISASKKDALVKKFIKFFDARIKAMNTINEDENATTPLEEGGQVKKFPLNLQMADDKLCVGNARLVDVEWEVLHCMASKNLNRIFEPRFLIKLTVLATELELPSEAPENERIGLHLHRIPECAKNDKLKLKTIEFECSQEEL